jgi:hypothetical protein
MNPGHRPDRLSGWLRCLRATTLLSFVGLLVVACSLGQHARSEPGKDEPNKEETPKTPGKPAAKVHTVEVPCPGHSILRLVIRDDKLPLTTPYGKLSIPVADIERIEFATRLSDEDARRIDAALARLGHAQFQEREAASAELAELGIKAYPALLKAARNPDPEVVRRAEQLLARVRESVADEDLVVREHDIIHTQDAKIAGRIDLKALTVSTPKLGDRQVKLTDIYHSRALGLIPEEDLSKVADGPVTLSNLQGMIGKSFRFRVTGAVTGTVWGTGTYTSDSPLAAVVVHAGLLKPGQAGIVKVTIVAPLDAYQGSVSNGVASSDYGPWPGAYQVSR